MILWFSGTYNSRWVAEQLSMQLGMRMSELRPSITSTPLTIDGDDETVIWVCPVYSWGIPPYVRSMIRGISFNNGVESRLTHHLVVTCGDDCGLAADMWSADVKSRGWQVGNAYSVIMPNNYVCMKGFDVDPKQVEAAKLNAAPERVEAIAMSLKNYIPNTSTDDVTKGSFAWIKTKIIYPWFVRHAMSPKPFHYTSACISCGKCAAICPLRNITMRPDAQPDSSGRLRKHPAWGDNCVGCLACYHVCPRHAVMYGNATRKKGQYFNPLGRTI
ncbi:MAG: EFR1 family ferrodoxin [Bacteroides sp.]|nr:EFR1 family ferrodoxin [Bacteroides sp.]